MGEYPTIVLKDARDRRDEAKKLLASGKDPSLERKKKAIAAVVSSQNTFDAVAGEFLAKLKGDGVSDVSWLRFLFARPNTVSNLNGGGRAADPSGNLTSWRH